MNREPRYLVMNWLADRLIKSLRLRFCSEVCSSVLFLLVMSFCQTSLAAISVGGRVSVTQNGVNVRAGAGSSTINGTQNSGALGTVIGGPTNAQIGGAGTTYTWWNVNFDSGTDGWVANIYLAEVTPSQPGAFTLSNDAPVWDAAIGGPKVNLTWGASSNATSYDLYRDGNLYSPGITQLSFLNSAMRCNGFLDQHLVSWWS